MEFAIHGSQTCGFVWLMSTEDLYWNYECILKQVIENHSIEDVHRSIIRGRGKQGILLRESHLANGLVVILQVLIRLGAHVHIKPHNLLVIGSQDEVVTLGMKGN